MRPCGEATRRDVAELRKPISDVSEFVCSGDLADGKTCRVAEQIVSKVWMGVSSVL